MPEAKRKNKPGAGRPATGRTYRINSFRVRESVGQEFMAAAQSEGVGPLVERLWAERRIP